MQPRERKIAPGIPGTQLPRAARERSDDEAMRLRRERDDELAAERLAERYGYPPPVTPVPSAPRVEQASLPLIPTGLAATHPTLARYAGWAAIIGALGGGAGITHVLTLLRPPPADPMPQLSYIREELNAQSEALTEIRREQRATRAVEKKRWQLVEAVVCKLNGGRPFATGVECDDVEFEALPISKTYGPGWKASKLEWPNAQP